MSDHLLEKLFEHNNWANLQIVRACAALTDAQLDAEPTSATQGSIRSTLTHMLRSQRGYLRQLTTPLQERLDSVPTPAMSEMEAFARSSGEELIALARDTSKIIAAPIETRDGFRVEPWVVVLQIINHATEHREQIKSMLTAQGFTPPSIDGWDYGEFTGAMVPVEKAGNP
jgi:uncharacterized damage-inducible protein DinB